VPLGSTTVFSPEIAKLVKQISRLEPSRSLMNDNTERPCWFWRRLTFARNRSNAVEKQNRKARNCDAPVAEGRYLTVFL
jgi:hypothetical protein